MINDIIHNINLKRNIVEMIRLNSLGLFLAIETYFALTLLNPKSTNIEAYEAVIWAVMTHP